MFAEVCLTLIEFDGSSQSLSDFVGVCLSLTENGRSLTKIPGVSRRLLESAQDYRRFLEMIAIDDQPPRLIVW